MPGIKNGLRVLFLCGTTCKYASNAGWQSTASKEWRIKITPRDEKVGEQSVSKHLNSTEGKGRGPKSSHSLNHAGSGLRADMWDWMGRGVRIRGCLGRCVRKKMEKGERKKATRIRRLVSRTPPKALGQARNLVVQRQKSMLTNPTKSKG